MTQYLLEAKRKPPWPPEALRQEMLRELDELVARRVAGQ